MTETAYVSQAVGVQSSLRFLKEVFHFVSISCYSLAVCNSLCLCTLGIELWLILQNHSEYFKIERMKRQINKRPGKKQERFCANLLFIVFHKPQAKDLDFVLCWLMKSQLVGERLFGYQLS